MSNWWSPKPLRTQDNSLFPLVERDTVVKSRSAIEKQRDNDGTPHARGNVTSLRAADAQLSLAPSLMKGSLVEKVNETKGRPTETKQDPQDPMAVIKAYMESREAAKSCGPEEKEEKKPELSKGLGRLKSAIHSFADVCGASIGRGEDE